MTDESTLDDLELELRMLPGVRSAGFDEHDDVLFVQVHLGTDARETPDPMAATRIAARHADRPVAVEVAHWRTIATAMPAIDPAIEVERFVDLTSDAPIDDDVDTGAAGATGGDAPRTNRPRLLAVLVFPETDELEVHLIHDGRRTIGRAPASHGLVGAVEATIEAIRGLGAPIEPRAAWARAIDGDGDGDGDGRELVAVAVTQADNGPTVHYGLASGASAIDAAARSTLDALNRQLARVL